MSDPVGTYNDGGIKFIRQVITAKDTSGANTQYIVKEGSLEDGVKRTTSTNENDVENKQNFTGTIPTGSLTLQFIQPTDLRPKKMQAITVIDDSGQPQNVIIGKVGLKFGAAPEAMVNVDIYAKQG